MLFMNIIWKQKQVLPQTAIVVLGVKDNLSTRWSRQKYQSQENVFRNRRISRRWPSLERERTIIDRLFYWDDVLQFLFSFRRLPPQLSGPRAVAFLLRGCSFNSPSWFVIVKIQYHFFWIDWKKPLSPPSENLWQTTLYIHHIIFKTQARENVIFSLTL